MNLPRGFSLIELVITIVVLGIIAVTAGAFLLPAFNAHRDLERRAALVEAAESAIRRMSRDIRISVPNSVRVTNALAVGSGFAIELIPTGDGVRYCSVGTADCSDTLDIGNLETVFDALGCYRNAAFIAASGTATYRLVVGNTGSEVYTATGTPAVISPVGTTLTLSIFPGTGATPTVCGSDSATANSSNRHRTTLSLGHTFSTASPRQRVFAIEDATAPVTYICNFSAGIVTRYAGYKSGAAYSTAGQPTDPAAAPLSGATGRLVANNVTGCSVTSTEATVQTSSIVTLNLTLSDSGETVQLINQVQLDNSQ
jgi:MSHA biogenesis protein MshO